METLSTISAPIIVPATPLSSCSLTQTPTSKSASTSVRTTSTGRTSPATEPASASACPTTSSTTSTSSASPPALTEPTLMSMELALTDAPIPSMPTLICASAIPPAPLDLGILPQISASCSARQATSVTSQAATSATRYVRSPRSTATLFLDSAWSRPAAARPISTLMTSPANASPNVLRANRPTAT